MKELLEGWVQYQNNLPAAEWKNSWDQYIGNAAINLQVELVNKQINYINAEEYLSHPERFQGGDPNRHLQPDYLAESEDLRTFQRLLNLPSGSTWIPPTSQGSLATYLTDQLHQDKTNNNFYIPYCIRENHWVTIVLKRNAADRSKFEMNVYNSMGEQEDDDKALLAHIGQIVGEKKIKLAANPVLSVNQTLRQHDDASCGYYCLMNAVLDANDQHIPDANKHSVSMDQKVRSYFAALENKTERLPSVYDFMYDKSSRAQSPQSPVVQQVNSAPKQDSRFMRTKEFLFSWYQHLLTKEKGDLKSKWQEQLATAQPDVKRILEKLVQDKSLEPTNINNVTAVARKIARQDLLEKAKASELVMDGLKIIKDIPEIKNDVLYSLREVDRKIIQELFDHGFDCQRDMHLLSNNRKRLPSSQKYASDKVLPPDAPKPKSISSLTKGR